MCVRGRLVVMMEMISDETSRPGKQSGSEISGGDKSEIIGDRQQSQAVVASKR